MDELWVNPEREREREIKGNEMAIARAKYISKDTIKCDACKLS